MDYDAVAAHFLTPGPQPVPAPAVPSSTARRLRDALEPIATIGWWSREAAAAMVGLGHDFFDGYVWGRAASLGADVSAPAVVAAFGVFEPAMLTAVFAHGSSVSSREQILRARAAGAAAGLDAATADLDPLVITRLGDVLLPALADLDCTGRPLFGSLRGLPLPDTPAGRAWRAAELVREHRGDGHLAASVAAGLDAVEMNVLTEVWLAYPVGGVLRDASVQSRPHRSRSGCTAWPRLARRGRQHHGEWAFGARRHRGRDRRQPALAHGCLGLGDRGRHRRRRHGECSDPAPWRRTC